MSLEDLLIDELRMRCVEKNLDFEKMRETLKMIGSETVDAFLYGVGMAPDNPTTLLDLTIATQAFIFCFEAKVNGERIRSFFRIDDIQTVLVTTLPQKVRLDVTLKGFGSSFFVNNPSERQSNVLAFAGHVRNKLHNIALR